MTDIRTQHDPVCHMDIDPRTAAGSSDFDGNTYFFCSRGCKLDFDEDPYAALLAEAAYDHSQPMQHMAVNLGPPRKKSWWRFW